MADLGDAQRQRRHALCGGLRRVRAGADGLTSVASAAALSRGQSGSFADLCNNPMYMSCPIDGRSSPREMHFSLPSGLSRMTCSPTATAISREPRTPTFTVCARVGVLFPCYRRAAAPTASHSSFVAFLYRLFTTKNAQQSFNISKVKVLVVLRFLDDRPVRACVNYGFCLEPSR